MKTSTLLGAGTLLILLWLFPFYYIGGLDAPFPNIWASSFAPLLGAVNSLVHGNPWSAICVIGVVLLIWGIAQMVRGLQTWKRPKPFTLLKTGLLLLFLWILPYYCIYFFFLGYIHYFRLDLLVVPLIIASRNLNPWHAILVAGIILLIAGTTFLIWQAVRGLGRKRSGSCQR